MNSTNYVCFILDLGVLLTYLKQHNCEQDVEFVSKTNN